MTSDNDGLFASRELSKFLDEQRAAVDDALERWPPDALLATPDPDVVDHLARIGRIEKVVLDLDAAVQLQPHDATWPDPTYDFLPGRPRLLKGVRYSLAIPFTGDAQLFDLQPNPYYPGPLDAVIEDDTVVVSFNGSTNPTSVKAGLDGVVNHLKLQVKASGNNVDQHNAHLEQTLPEKVAARKTKLLRIRDVQASLGFPIKKRADAQRHHIPVTRKAVALSVTTEKFKPEPELAKQDYEATLGVLLNGRNAFERSPSMAAKLDEEHIRDLLLLILNAQFEGKAGGELFNAAGKTDILIRHEDRNVFIGECKIWRGPKSVVDAIDQLLGYLTWRDTKAALVIFIKGGNPTEVISKAVDAITRHANHKRRGKYTNPDRCDFVLHANGDESREIHLALLPFIVTPPRP